jgi:hypothetical protein
VTTGHKTILLYFAIVGFVLIPARSNAQWWTHQAPSDFEECSESADKTATSKEIRASLMSECDAKFAGRRKPGGGYTYYDFMQNRHFDIAGPNPTPEELRQIDEQYTKFLDQQRQSIIAAAFTEKQQQQSQLDLANEKQITPARSPPPRSPVPLPVSRPRLRSKTVNCSDQSISCGWSNFGARLEDLKKALFGASKKTSG